MEKLPFERIDHYPSSISTSNVLCRMIAGLGFRYYWATHNLRKEDLNFRPSESGKSCFETLTHINYLGLMMHSCAFGNAIERGKGPVLEDLDEIRFWFLTHLKETHDKISALSDPEIEHLKIRYQSSSSTMEYPFWHFINGPLSDALYHVGQIVVFRRANGNSIASGVNVFLGEKI
ncbi:DinB family protein [Luteibaculum oceani]|uniref:DinB family protein n=1 Tax=Luteibaculum oceani TaxID=1294296 RepID=A0A5C6USM2_9FLAO|nr:hypothetical protein [Luteibaculum oceani]TXC76247.1 hypothetical protein FRX97_10900 [Luteibaculum oceani]